MDRHSLWITSDSYKRHVYVKHELKKTLLKSITVNRYTTNSRRYLASFLRSRLPRFTSKSYLRNRCVVTGRVWGSNKYTKTSRFAFRTSAYSTQLPGFKRASW